MGATNRRIDGPRSGGATLHRRLDPTKVIATVRQLRDRIQERFPESGLASVAGELLAIATESAERSQRLGRPYVLLRVLIWLVTATALVLLGWFAFDMNLQTRMTSLLDVVQALESGINDIIFVAVAIFFLFTYETRLKRNRALEAVHELRVLSHVVDMHQLTKDPGRLLAPGTDTVSSPKRTMSRFELARYLDYCSEMLSLISKIAAMYVEYIKDPVVLEAVDGIEDLTNGLSRKVWQKITVLDQAVEPTPQAVPQVGEVWRESNSALTSLAPSRPQDPKPRRLTVRDEELPSDA